jgi:hypothetical protein
MSRYTLYARFATRGSSHPRTTQTHRAHTNAPASTGKHTNNTRPTWIYGVRGGRGPYRAGGCARRAPLRGEAEGRRAARGCAKGAAHRASGARRLRAVQQEAARDAPRSEAKGCRAARGCARGATHRVSGARRPRAVESRRLRATRPAQWPRAVGQHEAVREALLTERAARGGRGP